MHILLILGIAIFVYFCVAQPLWVTTNVAMENAERRNERESGVVRFDAGDRLTLKLASNQAILDCIPKEMNDRRMIEDKLKAENPDFWMLPLDEKEKRIHDALVLYYRDPATPPPYVKWVNSYPCPSQEWRDYLMELGCQSHNRQLGNPKFPEIP